jgi:hypothetical protein
MDVKDLRRGDVVMAVKYLDAADVHAGTLGVVFEETNAYGDGGGPMVRFMNMCACNVYHGQVVRVGDPDGLELLNKTTGEVVGDL